MEGQESYGGRTLADEVEADGQAQVADTDLALAWLHANYVHQDVDAHQPALRYLYEYRFQAAVLLLCNVAYHAKATLTLAHKLADRRIIDLQIPPQPPLPPLPG